MSTTGVSVDAENQVAGLSALEHAALDVGDLGEPLGQVHLGIAPQEADVEARQPTVAAALGHDVLVREVERLVQLFQRYLASATTILTWLLAM